MKLTRRGLLGGVAIAGASAVGGAGTFAYLNDEQGTAMTINVGTLALDNTQEFSFQENGETEGEDTFETTITIVNDGTLPVRQVVLSGVVFDSGTDLASALKITDMRYGREDSMSARTSILSDVESDENGNGIFDLEDLKTVLDSSEVLLEELIDETEPENGEVLHVGDEAHLDIVAEWDYEKVPEGSDGAQLQGSIIIEGRQQESS